MIEDTRRVLIETAHDVSMTEAADLAGIHRSTAHDYLKAAD